MSKIDLVLPNVSEIAAGLKKLREAIDEFDRLVTLDNPKRQAGESLIAWHKRLERAGIVDQPEIRWMYQQECWRSVVLFWRKGE
ncbi:MAG: hypothetical protein ACFE0Q_20690 [Anaerolineae bacterium]